MSQFFNTLYVTQPNSYLAKDHETVIIKREGQIVLQVPLHHLLGIVCLSSSIGVSPELVNICNNEKISISFLSDSGRFLGRVEGMKGGMFCLGASNSARPTAKKFA